jgi:L-arabinonolactonase
VFGAFNQADDPKHPIGGFYRLNRDLSLERLPLGDVAIANSICFSPDGRTMYYCDSATREIRCCDYAPDSGAVSRLRVFAQADAAPGDPDGSTIDAEGYLWNARWGAGQVVRFAPDGSVDRYSNCRRCSRPAWPSAGPGSTCCTSPRPRPGSRLQLAARPARAAFSRTCLDVRGLPESRFGVGHIDI